MPNYEYKCGGCDHVIVINRGINDEEKIPRCLKCEVNYKKVFSLTGIQFNGSGFYSKDK